MTRLTDELRGLFRGWDITVHRYATELQLMPGGRRYEVAFYRGYMPIQYEELNPAQFIALRLRGVET